MSKINWLIAIISIIVIIGLVFLFKNLSSKNTSLKSSNTFRDVIQSQPQQQSNIQILPKPIPYNQPLPPNNYIIFGVNDKLTLNQKIYTLMNLFSPVYNFHSEEKFYPGTFDSCNNISIKNLSDNTVKNITNTLDLLYLNDINNNIQIYNNSILINSKNPDFNLIMNQDIQTSGLNNDQIKTNIINKYANIVGDLYNPYFEQSCNTYYHRNCPGASLWSNVMTNVDFASSIITINKTINWKLTPQVCTIIHKPIIRNNKVLLDNNNNPVFVTDFIYTCQYIGKNLDFDINNTTVAVRFLTSDLQNDIYGDKPPMPCRFYLSTSSGGQWYSPKDLNFRQLNQKCINPIVSNTCPSVITISAPGTTIKPLNFLGTRNDLGSNSVSKTHVNIYVSKDTHNLYPNINVANKLLGNSISWQPPAVFLERPQTLDSWNVITSLTDDYFSVYYSRKNVNLNNLLKFLTDFDFNSSNGYNTPPVDLLNSTVGQYPGPGVTLGSGTLGSGTGATAPSNNIVQVINKTINTTNYVLSPFFGFGMPYLYYTGKCSAENYTSLFMQNKYIFREASCLPTSDGNGKIFSNHCKYCAGSLTNTYPYLADKLPKPLMDNNIDYIKGVYSTIICNTNTYQKNITNINLKNIQALGSGINGYCYCMVTDFYGNIYVGGSFASVNSNINYIAKWDGSKWSSLGSGLTGPCYCLEIDSAGNIYAGGQFNTAGGVTVNNIAKWDGSKWSSLGTGLSTYFVIDAKVFAIKSDLLGNIYVGGNFTIANGTVNKITTGGINAKYIAKWNGTTWSALDASNNGICYSLAIDSSNNLYAGGQYILKWNGNSFSKLGINLNVGFCYSLVIDLSGNLYAGGTFTTINSVPASYIAKWNGSTWTSLGSGFNNMCNSLAIDSYNNLYAAGTFTQSGSINITNSVAKWDGYSWSALDLGLNNNDKRYRTNIKIDLDNNLYVGGFFTQAGDTTVNNIVKVSITYPDICKITQRLYGTVKAITSIQIVDTVPPQPPQFRKKFKAAPGSIVTSGPTIYPEKNIYRSQLPSSDPIINTIQTFYNENQINYSSPIVQRNYDSSFGIALTGKTSSSAIGLCALFKYILNYLKSKDQVAKTNQYYIANFFNNFSYVSTVYAGSCFWALFTFVFSNRPDIDIDDLLGKNDKQNFSSTDFIGSRFEKGYTYWETLLDMYNKYSLDRYWGVILGKYLLDYYKLNDDIPVSLNLFHEKDMKTYNTDIKSTLVYDKYNILPFWVSNTTLNFDYAGVKYPKILINLTPLYSGIPLTYKVQYQSQALNQIGGVLIDTFAFGNTPAPNLPIETPSSSDPKMLNYDPNNIDYSFALFTGDNYFNWLISNSRRSIRTTCLRDILAMSSNKDKDKSSTGGVELGSLLLAPMLGTFGTVLSTLGSLYSGSYYLLNSLTYSNLLWGTLQPQIGVSDNECEGVSCTTKNGIIPRSCKNNPNNNPDNLTSQINNNTYFCINNPDVSSIQRTYKFTTQLSYIDSENNNADPSGIISLISRGVRNILFFVYSDNGIGKYVDDYLYPLFNNDNLYKIFDNTDYVKLRSLISKNMFVYISLNTSQNKINIPVATEIKLLIIYIKPNLQINQGTSHIIDIYNDAYANLSKFTNIVQQTSSGIISKSQSIFNIILESFLRNDHCENLSIEILGPGVQT